MSNKISSRNSNIIFEDEENAQRLRKQYANKFKVILSRFESGAKLTPPPVKLSGISLYRNHSPVRGRKSMRSTWETKILGVSVKERKRNIYKSPTRVGYQKDSIKKIQDKGLGVYQMKKIFEIHDQKDSDKVQDSKICQKNQNNLNCDQQKDRRKNNNKLNLIQKEKKLGQGIGKLEEKNPTKEDLLQEGTKNKNKKTIQKPNEQTNLKLSAKYSYTSEFNFVGSDQKFPLGTKFCESKKTSQTNIQGEFNDIVVIVGSELGKKVDQNKQDKKLKNEKEMEKEKEKEKENEKNKEKEKEIWVAIRNYQGKTKVDISFKIGDQIEVVEKTNENGEWVGKIDGKMGFFPSCYVGLSKPTIANNKEKKNKISSRSGNNHKKKGSSKKKSFNRSDKKMGERERDTKIIFALQTFQNLQNIQGKVLTFVEGDQIQLIEKFEDGWWYGQMNDQKGFFPSNLVQEIETDSWDYLKANHNFENPQKIKCALTFKKGDTFLILKKSNQEWCKVKFNTKIGYVPLRYCEIIKK
ncbi:hypothetical protein M0812_09190 [Anaeramoeba flamelloides]|uniref:SH3 domain-containing protein n=1 Tax=Anaeramoeba flamelloides TaxID=1746091 RepID=A0AAV7ZP11_9EUKA|nr:hypothetical protein M0812_09190 [Anaeramoeba flamelloides]